MTDLLATLWVHPLMLTRIQQVLLLLPLCLTISVVYKTTKCSTVREIPAAVAISWITIVIGMYAVGAILLVLYTCGA